MTTLVKLSYVELKAQHPEKVKEARVAWLKSRSKHNRVRADRLSWGICWIEIVDVAAAKKAQAKGRRASMACRFWGVREPRVVCWYPKASQCPFDSHTLAKESTPFSFIPVEVKQFIRTFGQNVPIGMTDSKSFYMDMPLVTQEFA